MGSINTYIHHLMAVIAMSAQKECILSFVLMGKKPAK
jgi:hypothetical protein